MFVSTACIFKFLTVILELLMVVDIVRFSSVSRYSCRSPAQLDKSRPL